MSVLVGVDLGGTNIRAAVATGPYTHEPPVHEPTPAHDGPEAVVERGLTPGSCRYPATRSPATVPAVY